MTAVSQSKNEKNEIHTSSNKRTNSTSDKLADFIRIVDSTNIVANIKKMGSEIKQGLDDIVSAASAEEAVSDAVTFAAAATRPPSSPFPSPLPIGVPRSRELVEFASSEDASQPKVDDASSTDSSIEDDDDKEEITPEIVITTVETQRDIDDAQKRARENEENERKIKDQREAELAMMRRQLDRQIVAMKMPPTRKGTIGPIVATASSLPNRDRYEANRVCNIALLGNSGVGKTTLARRFCSIGDSETDTDERQTSEVPIPDPTISLDFLVRTMRLPKTNERVDVQLWDTAGSERYRAIVNQYFRCKDAFVLTYAVDDRKSFDSILQWANDARGGSPDALMFLVGTKEDARDDPYAIASKRDVEAMAQLVRANQTFVTSAKKNRNVRSTFAGIVSAVFEAGDARRSERDVVKTGTTPAFSRSGSEMANLLCGKPKLAVRDSDGNYVVTMKSTTRAANSVSSASAFSLVPFDDSGGGKNNKKKKATNAARWSWC